MRTRVKICGFTRVEDALCAASLGVDAIGMVFYPPSPRHIEIEQAEAIAGVLPAFVSVAALFVDAEPAFITEVLRRIPVDCIQFHGNEAAEVCRGFNRPYIKAVRMRAETRITELERQYFDARGLLLDAYHPALPGGSGGSFDWGLIPADRNLPMILAGGLTTENIGEAIRKVKPYALDVSSGVESEKGVKDAEKMAAFIRTTNRAIEVYD
ncbi:MAG: phosphoribosylanthranilate isomerase [Methylomonas sp.]